MGDNNEGIAVVGIACQFPGASNKDEFWKNLLEGKESITRLADEDLSKYEVGFSELEKDPNFVKSRGILKDVESWDPAFFGYTPYEAKYMDPQQRLWLETVWHSFEDAGCDPYKYKGAIGVYGGTIQNTYLLNNILRSPAAYENYIRNRTAHTFQTYLSNEPGYLATRTAFVFDLKGPAVSVQTACSTSLVAISQACSSLFAFETDMCIAGGVSILVPQETGYVYQEGAIVSPDGHCRPYDADGKGTVFGNGAGVVVLKRLDDALKDNDRIYAVIKGWALNNDGKDKVGYTAPSVDGQSEVISMAQSFASVDPEDICYIEGHGTATPLGDPIEIAALTKAFRARTQKKQYCALGSVKSNLGHLDAAAGVAGFIKIALSAYHKIVPPTLHFKSPNPRLKLEDSPFYVNAEALDLKGEREVIMGVSSFGVGGTNAHVLLENHLEERNEIAELNSPKLVLISANSSNSLKNQISNHVSFLQQHSNLANNIVYTLQYRRKHMGKRAFGVLHEGQVLKEEDIKILNNAVSEHDKKLTFMFPGQGAQFPGMGSELYKNEPVFKERIDALCELYARITGSSIKEIILGIQGEGNIPDLSNTEITQPALFIVEYALSELYKHYGIEPDYMIGHSIGEYVAACIAGVFGVEEALKIVIKRGQLMSQMPEGDMLAVFSEENRVRSLESDLFEIAAVNSPRITVISVRKGNSLDVQELLKSSSLEYVKLNTSHAFHSADFDPILEEFSSFVSGFNMNQPAIPFISCLSGKFIESEQAISGDYWARQLRSTVLFNKGIETLSEIQDMVFMEVGPQTHLSNNLHQMTFIEDKATVITSIGKQAERSGFYMSLGHLWALSVHVDFNTFYPKGLPQMVSLPVYSFDKQKCWIDYIPVAQSIDSESQVEPEGATISESGSIIVDEDLSVQSRLLNIWEEVLGIGDIQPDDDFFVIGGHSLLGLQILNRISQEFGIEIPLQRFLSNSSILEIEKHLESQGRKFEKDSTDLLDQIASEGIIESKEITLTSDQKRLWLNTLADKTNPAYNIPNTLKFRGEVSESLLVEALDAIVKRHTVFNTIIKLEEGQPHAYIKEAGLSVKVSDWSDIDINQEEHLQEYLTEDIRKPFDFENGPLYRFEIIRLNSDVVILHMNIHHVIIDGWSWGILSKELNQIYDDLKNKRKISLPAQDIQYYHYSSWLERKDSTEYDSKAAEYWKEKLSGISGVINFPYDNKRNEVFSGLGGRIRFKLSEEITQKLNSLSKEMNVSLFSTMISAFGLLLHRYSQDEDVCIGIPIANRLDQRLENLIGLFVNTLVLRMDFVDRLTFKDFVLRNQESILEAFTYQEFSFDKLIEAIQPGRTSNMNPVFQVMFAWQNSPRQDVDINGNFPETVIAGESVSPLDLSVYAWEIDKRIELEFEYSKDLFNDDSIDRLILNFVALLEGIVKDIDQNYSKYNILSKKEKLLLSKFNNTFCDLPEILLHDLFRQTATKYGEKTALVSDEDRISYTQLDKWSDQLAQYLYNKGVRQGDIVGMSLNRGIRMVVSVLGIIKAGAAYLPLDPTFPDDRLHYMLDDSSAKVLITQQEIVSRFEDFSHALLLIDNEWKQIIQSKDSPVSLSMDNQFLTYLIYTSGSTGKPKGVKVHHEAVINFLRSMAKAPGFNETNKLLAVTTMSFDISVLEIFLPLIQGGTVVMAGDTDSLDGKRLIFLIEKEEIDTMQATPATWNIILQSGWEGKSDLVALCGGEEVPANLISKLLPKVNKMWNVYGPTETTVWSTCKELKDASVPVLIGAPIDNTQVYFFDKYENIMPVGAFGELCIGGKGVTKGYHNREDLTHEKFVSLAEEIIYKTGDVGRYLDNGEIELLGRIDNQIKLRGFRIEPGEIEFLLSKIDGIEEVVVKLMSFGEYDDRLVAFVKGEDGFELNIDSIVESLSADIPAYMIPSGYKQISEFPRTLNNKINKKALTVTVEELGRPRKVEKQEMTKTEEAVYSIWKKALKSENFSVNDSFFEIGGNSLMAVSIMSDIESEFGFDIGLRVFFDGPRISQIAERIDNSLSSASDDKEAGTDSNSRIISGEI